MSLWVFAYGSLIFRPSRYFGPPRAAVVHGYKRAFRQASTDHRGTPEFPGRVVTLLGDATSKTAGAVFEVASPNVEAALIELDERESGGYERAHVSAHVYTCAEPVRALTWIAAPHNENHMPEVSLDELVNVVRRARGQSGANRDYVLKLAEALRALGVFDQEVFALEQALLAATKFPP
ncbi:MAG: gamma-glutamylcyclotransferase [Polyangiaceae bacterium]|nr:gamma-glutamylcyclotransferase [Polyangiaceae bacterium]